MTHLGNVEPENIRIIRQCLERWFHDVTPGTYTERFVYHDGTQTSEFALDHEFVNALSPLRLKHYIEHTVLPTLRASPGNVIRVGVDGISVRARQMHQPTACRHEPFSRS
jgi:hypothetical protein